MIVKSANYVQEITVLLIIKALYAFLINIDSDTEKIFFPAQQQKISDKFTGSFLNVEACN